jgi:hypothetical protein
VEVISLEIQLESLLTDLCTTLGFCSVRGDARNEITSRLRWDATEFAIAVLKAEGFEGAEYESKWIKVLRQKFIDRFGRTIVSSADFEP